MRRVVNKPASLKCPDMRIFLVLPALLTISGCTRFNHLEYGPFVRDLDGLSELAISTYPADFPKRLSDKGALFQKYETSRDVYFRIHIRDKKIKLGPNPHADSVKIHSFSYSIDDGPPVVLLSGYEDNLWMQNNPRYERRELPAVPYVPNGIVSIEISFTLNGEDFVFEGDMRAAEKSRVLPSIVANQSI